MSEIHLVTDDDTTDELVRVMFGSLPVDFQLPSGMRASDARIVRKSSTASALAAFTQATAPVLIVLDGSVRRKPTDSACTDGSAAAELLRELRKRAEKTPILERR
jgi:hypothetical protein